MDKISFQGPSKLIFDPNMYGKCCETTKKACRHISGETSRKVTEFTNYTIGTDSNNLILYMGNEKTGFLTTVPIVNSDSKTGAITTIPTEEKEELLLNIEEIANNLLKKAKDKLTVWIIGGDKIQSKSGNETVKSVNELAEILCDRPDIDASILAGSDNATNKVVFKQAGGKLDVTIGNDIKPSCINEEELAEHYDIVELNNVI